MERYSFKEMLLKAKREKYAVGAFNILNHITAKAAIKAAEEVNSPIILQTSVSTVKQIGVIELIDMLHSLTKNASVPVAIHLDHCTDIQLAKDCIDAGWDAVMIDASAKPFDENVAITLEIKRYAEKRQVDVEGELGVICGVEDEVASDIEKATDYEDAARYLSSTSIDAFAPAVGTAHGLYTKEVVLNFDLVQKLNLNSDCPVVIHGGTGLTDDNFRQLIACGATKINISTAIKYAYIDAYKKYFEMNPTDYNPLKLDRYVEESIKEVVKKHLVLFDSVDRAK
jgi:fructose-bisphosphate aldolase class II